MRDSFLRSFSGNNSSSESDSTESWLNRVRENLGQLLIPSHFKPSSVNGAPIHLLKFDKSLRPARAQGASLLTHAAVFAAILLVLTHGPKGPTGTSFNGTMPLPALKFPTALFHTLANANTSGGSGSGGDQNPIPATRGELLPSAIVLVKPTLPQNQHPALPEPPTIF